MAAPCEVRPRLASHAFAAGPGTNWNGVAFGPPVPKFTSALSEPATPVALKATPWKLPTVPSVSVIRPPSPTAAMIDASVNVSGTVPCGTNVVDENPGPPNALGPSSGRPGPAPVNASIENEAK